MVFSHGNDSGLVLHRLRGGECHHCLHQSVAQRLTAQQESSVEGTGSDSRTVTQCRTSGGPTRLGRPRSRSRSISSRTRTSRFRIPPGKPPGRGKAPRPGRRHPIRGSKTLTLHVRGQTALPVRGGGRPPTSKIETGPEQTVQTTTNPRGRIPAPLFRNQYSAFLNCCSGSSAPMKGKTNGRTESAHSAQDGRTGTPLPDPTEAFGHVEDGRLGRHVRHRHAPVELTAPYPWLTWLCALLMISNAVYLGVCSEYDDEPDSSRHQVGHN
jgi:hypothetical protein